MHQSQYKCLHYKNHGELTPYLCEKRWKHIPHLTMPHKKFKTRVNKCTYRPLFVPSGYWSLTNLFISHSTVMHCLLCCFVVFSFWHKWVFIYIYGYMGRFLESLSLTTWFHSRNNAGKYFTFLHWRLSFKTKFNF